VRFLFPYSLVPLLGAGSSCSQPHNVEVTNEDLMSALRSPSMRLPIAGPTTSLTTIPSQTMMMGGQVLQSGNDYPHPTIAQRTRTYCNRFHYRHTHPWGSWVRSNGPCSWFCCCCLAIFNRVGRG
jgi:hypothetical protein